MDSVTEMNFKAVQQAIVELTNKYETQEKRINSYIQTQQMLMEQLNKMQQEVCIIKANNMGTGPTKVD